MGLSLSSFPPFSQQTSTASMDTPQIPEFFEFPFKEKLDIVIYTREPTKLYRFLKKWKEIFQAYDLVVIVEGDDDASLKIGTEMITNARYTNEFRLTMYTRRDIELLMKERAACISKDDAAARCFGFLMSKKKFILTIDVDCLIAKNPAGEDINPIIQHSFNLMSPATPFFLNPTYDPYKFGNGFSLGYPVCLRNGVPTAISHGLWLNMPHYDASSQLAKPGDRSSDYVYSVSTIPKGCLFPMCGMNLCFNRELIGLAMYFGLMGKDQPLSRYGEVWGGFCSKVICDHLKLGVKTGMPYVWNNGRDYSHNSCKMLANWVEWDEKIYKFFQDISFPVNCGTVEKCYRHLANQVKEKLGVLDPYFSKLADGMILWTEAWVEQNPPADEVKWSNKAIVN